MRTYVVPTVMPLALRLRKARAITFRTVSQLAIGYRNSIAVDPDTRRWQRSPRSGDRLPDAPVVNDCAVSTLHEIVSSPMFQLLLYGAPVTWDQRQLHHLRERYGSLLSVQHIARDPHPGSDTTIEGWWPDACGYRDRHTYSSDPTVTSPAATEPT